MNFDGHYIAAKSREEAEQWLAENLESVGAEVLSVRQYSWPSYDYTSYKLVGSSTWGIYRSGDTRYVAHGFLTTSEALFRALGGEKK